MKTFLLNKEQYLNVIATWKKSPGRFAEDMILFNVLRSYDPKRGFTPIKNENKLRSVSSPLQAFVYAKANAKLQVKPPVKLTHDTDTRWEYKTSTYATRMKLMKEKYGIEFTEELCNKIIEALDHE